MFALSNNSCIVQQIATNGTCAEQSLKQFRIFSIFGKKKDEIVPKNNIHFIKQKKTIFAKNQIFRDK